ncbi:MAG TPA: DNA-3-methyladenine glycosylase I [Ottowia sp.]|uniref:DNA-3-methyladenine glycosylase I n=1 Tax=Ottowia sp. TaxID=1898956 RepID=UPI002B5323AC|nr:DNA-3-methyladenine glycosylase I [Ottowia sp.]HMN20171.1 DNA-3-methyladenine glycosylase I [Ottowia sp.]
MSPPTLPGPDGLERCGWCLATPQYLAYHDTEWGFPVTEDRRLFEKLCLEGFQAGLSWRTILEKREQFRRAFAGFDFDQLARWGEPEVARLLRDAGIVRHRGKIEATLNNARRAQELARAEGSLAAYFWRHEPNADEQAACRHAPTSPTSIALSRELKRRGWRFVGPTTLQAFLLAMGLVNGHAEGCVVRGQAAAARVALARLPQ